MKYLLTIPSSPSLRVVFEYDENGLASIVFEGRFTANQKLWVLNNTPAELGDTDLNEYFMTDKVRITVADVDLSFQNFWNKYNHKQGNKPRAEKLWNVLTDSEKMLALAKLKKYLFDLANSNLEQAHASTWLNQRRWEN